MEHPEIAWAHDHVGTGNRGIANHAERRKSNDYDPWAPQNPSGPPEIVFTGNRVGPPVNRPNPSGPTGNPSFGKIVVTDPVELPAEIVFRIREYRIHWCKSCVADRGAITLFTEIRIYRKSSGPQEIVVYRKSWANHLLQIVYGNPSLQSVVYRKSINLKSVGPTKSCILPNRRCKSHCCKSWARKSRHLFRSPFVSSLIPRIYRYAHLPLRPLFESARPRNRGPHQNRVTESCLEIQMGPNQWAFEMQ